MNEDYINQYEDYLKIDKKYSMNTVSSYTKDLIKFSFSSFFFSKIKLAKSSMTDIK